MRRHEDEEEPEDSDRVPALVEEIIRDELRDIRARIGALEQIRDARAAAASKWGERGWDILKTVLAALLIAGILAGVQYVRCIPPSTPPKIEVHQ